MGKYVLCIGLVKDTENFCDTCHLIDKQACQCSVDRKLTVRKIDKSPSLQYVRPTDCPLVIVDNWPDENDSPDLGFTLC
jgi:hypothetical protein